MSRARIVAAATGLLGVIGLGLSLLPLVTFTASARLLQTIANGDMILRYGLAGSIEDYWDHACKNYQEHCAGKGGGGQLDVNAYDVISSGYTVTAVVPIALAVAVAVGALSAWRVHDSRVFTAVSLTSLGALAVLGFTFLNPSVAVSGSGELSSEAESSDVGTADFDFSIGLGLYLPAAVLTVIFLINAWQAVTTMLEDRRPKAFAPLAAQY